MRIAKIILKLHKQYVRPVLETGAVATASINNIAINKLQVVQNTALRLALRQDRAYKVDQLHLDCGILPIKDRLTFLQTRAVTRYGTSNAIDSLNHIKTVLLEAV